MLSYDVNGKGSLPIWAIFLLHFTFNLITVFFRPSVRISGFMIRVSVIVPVIFLTAGLISGMFATETGLVCHAN